MAVEGLNGFVQKKPLKVPELSQDTVTEVTARDVAQLAECLSNMYKALSLRPSAAQTGCGGIHL